MDIEIRRKDEILIAKIIGEIDHHTADEIRRQVDRAIVLPGIRGLIFDLSGLSFMDTSGIGVMAGRQKNISRLGGIAAVCGMSRQTKRMLELTGFAKLFTFFDGVETAFTQMKQYFNSERSGNGHAEAN